MDRKKLSLKPFLLLFYALLISALAFLLLGYQHPEIGYMLLFYLAFYGITFLLFLQRIGNIILVGLCSLISVVLDSFIAFFLALILTSHYGNSIFDAASIVWITVMSSSLEYNGVLQALIVCFCVTVPLFIFQAWYRFASKKAELHGGQCSIES